MGRLQDTCTGFQRQVRFGGSRQGMGGLHMETDALLSVEEAARKLGGISKWTVHQWLSQGKLCRTKVGGRTMIRESELAKVIQEGGKSATTRRKKHGAVRDGAIPDEI